MKSECDAFLLITKHNLKKSKLRKTKRHSVTEHAPSSKFLPS